MTAAGYCHRRPRPRRADERGGATVELVLLTPLLILVLVFVVALGRLASARMEVDSAAAQAARGASMARDPATAAALARSLATTSLAGHHLTCAPLSVSTDTAAFAPGGWLAVRVSCTASLAGLSLLRLPGAQTITSRFVEPLDVYRAAP
ncbi:MAG: TadE/TadG family type IV pilus assembly protein [Acidimicrobiales bacterium]